MQITTIGLDIAKNVFQVHGIDANEKVVVRKQLRRSQVIAFFKALPPCLIGMEACATAHYWARELTKLGHEVRLMPAKDVKAYVKRNKNDAADAEAICEAVRRPRMRFVRAKSTEQQGRLMQHRTRDLLLRQQTQVINALRAHLAELGIVAAQGSPQRHAEQEAQPGHDAVAVTDADAGVGQVQLEGPDVLTCRRGGRPLQKRSKPLTAADVASLRARAELARIHIFNHTLTQRGDSFGCHKQLLS
jgi:transposase